MDKEVKRLWVTDLESDEFEQGQGFLRDNNGKYCCLGVLCHRAQIMGMVGEPVLYSDYMETVTPYYIYGEERRGYDLPPEVTNWADLYDGDPVVEFTDDEIDEFFADELDEFSHSDLRCRSLADLNDHGYPFKLIAKIIDRKL